MQPNRPTDSTNADEKSQRIDQLELFELVADHLGIGVVLMGSQRCVELRTRLAGRLEQILGEGWYHHLVHDPKGASALAIKDALEREHAIALTQLSLFRQDDVIVMQDISASGHNQKRLREQQLQFQGIMQSARDAIISIDESGSIIHWNKAAETLFQYTAPEIKGTPITRIMPASYREAHQAALQNVVQEGALHTLGKTYVVEGLRKDNTSFPIELSLSNWQLEGRHYFTGFLRDITKRIQAAHSLQESQSRFALFMDHLPAAVFIKESGGRILYINDYLKTQFGAEGLQDTSTSEDFPEEIVEQLTCDDQMVLVKGYYEIVQHLRDREGKERTFRIANFAIPRPKEDKALVGGIAWDITNAVTAAEALRNSERRYREIFSTAEEGIWVIDEKGVTVEINNRMAKMLGYKVEEMLGQHLFLFMDEDARRIAERNLARRRSGIAEKHDFRLRTKAGTELWTIMSTVPMHDSHGAYSGALVMVTDITARKRAEDALRSKEERLRLILSSTGEGIFGLDMDGRCSFANRACVEMLGFTDETYLLGKRMHGLIHHTRPDGTNYPAEECPTYRSCTRRQITFADDEVLWRADGSSFHAEYQSFPLVRTDSVIGAVVSFADITERKRAEAAIKQERDFAESLIETAPVIVLVLDAEGNIVRFNSFFERLSGYPLAEVKGQNWIDHFLVRRDVPRAREVFAQAKDDIGTSGNVHAFARRDGRECLVAWYVTALRNPAGELTALLAIGHDVTEQKAQEAQLLQAQKMEMVGQLTGGIAHDFNNLLTVIMGNLELLAKSLGAEGDPDVFELLQDSLSAAQDGADLTQRLLAFSRKKPLQQKRIDLSEFLERFRRFLRHALGADIAVRMEVGTHLDILLCDPTQLESALLNLALNARDAMPNGGQLWLRARAKEAADLDPSLGPGPYVDISVTDTGEGMTSEQINRAIEPFYTTKHSKQGSGLGLSMVFGFCEQARGRFQLTSKPGLGTRASVILPLGAPDAQEDAQTHQSAPSDATGIGTILVVEDEDRVRKLAGRYLRASGYNVLLAESGDAAVRALQSQSPIDLVFSDVVMPGKIQGDDLYRWVKAQRPDVKILLTTGMEFAELKKLANGDESPFPINLPKPYTREQLTAIVRTMLAV